MNARGKMDAKKRTLLADVERALLDALAESPDVHRTLWRLQREGYTLRVLLDCQRDDDQERRGLSLPAPRTAAADPTAEPAFRIHAEDLRFLRSIGVDPTRRRSSRRGR